MKQAFSLTVDNQVVHQLIDDLADQGYGIIDDFLTHGEIREINLYLDKRREEGDLRKAGIGQGDQYQIRTGIRGDYILWFSEMEPSPVEKKYAEKIQCLINLLNRHLFAGVRDFETHFAIYPPGSFYRRHLDRFSKDDHRIITYISYLNEDWKPGDGGELKMYLSGNREDTTLTIEPIGGRLVMFRSHLIPHEVLETRVERRSITGWMLDQLKDVKSII